MRKVRRFKEESESQAANIDYEQGEGLIPPEQYDKMIEGE